DRPAPKTPTRGLDQPEAVRFAGLGQEIEDQGFFAGKGGKALIHTLCLVYSDLTQCKTMTACCQVWRASLSRRADSAREVRRYFADSPGPRPRGGSVRGST